MKPLDELTREEAIALLKRFRDVGVVLVFESIGDFYDTIIERDTLDGWRGSKWEGPRTVRFGKACEDLAALMKELRATIAARCRRCRGCGRIANSDDGEPWTVWENLPVKSAAAVIAGLVKPIPCPTCSGKGTVELEIGP